MTTIVSHRYRYIFVHIPKNAGSSVQDSLMRCEPMPRLQRAIWRVFMAFGSGNQTITFGRVANPHGTGWFAGAYHGHATAANMRALLPGHLFDSYFKFALVRNPWDRCVSRYEYYRKLVKPPPGEQLKSFPEFLDWDFQPQRQRIADANGNLLVDFVGKVETLARDMDHVFKTCGLPLSASAIGMLNTTDRRPYHNYYDDVTRELVRDKYREDVDGFGYEF
jgi:hypothetical protein